LIDYVSRVVGESTLRTRSSRKLPTMQSGRHLSRPWLSRDYTVDAVKKKRRLTLCRYHNPTGSKHRN